MNPDIHFTEDGFEQAERYLMGQMTASEKQLFEETLTANPKLQEAVAQMQLLILGVQEAELKTQLNRFHQELPQPQSPVVKMARHFPVRNWWAVASILLVLAACVWILFFLKNDRDKLYEAYFRPDPGLMTTMGTTDNYAFDRAMVDYKMGHYTAAIQAWANLLEAAPQNDTLNYFVGVAYLANDNQNNAAHYLQKVTTMPNSKFVQDAYWYLGLALLQAGKPGSAENAIRQSNHPQKEALLKELKKLP